MKSFFIYIKNKPASFNLYISAGPNPGTDKSSILVNIGASSISSNSSVWSDPFCMNNSN